MLLCNVFRLDHPFEVRISFQVLSEALDGTLIVPNLFEVRVKLLLLRLVDFVLGGAVCAAIMLLSCLFYHHGLLNEALELMNDYKHHVAKFNVLVVEIL